MSNYALIDLSTGIVVNSIALNEPTTWTPPDGFIVVQTDVAGIGWSYADGVFSPPPPPVLTPEEIVSANLSQQVALMMQASQSMTPVFMALQLDATDAATLAAKAWSVYYQALQAVDLTVESPAWPVAPSA